MNKLLIVTYHFPPSAASGGYRMLGLTRHLPACGWETTVVAPPSLPWESVDEALLGQVPAETAIHPVPYPRGRLVKPLRYLAPFGVWLPRAFAMARRVCLRERPDMVLTSGPPHCVHVLGLLLKQWLGVRWVADFRDPWVASAEAVPGTRPTGFWDRWCERRVMQQADLLVANAPLSCERLRRAYPDAADRMITIPNGYDPELFEGIEAGTPSTDTPSIVHTGTVYAGRDPRPFLDALTRLGDTAGRCRVSFVGRANEGGLDVGEEVRRRGLGSFVKLPGSLPYEEALREMAGASVLLLLDSAGRHIGVPAKLYEYLGAGRPILALAEPDGDVAAVLAESGVLYRLAAPGDAAAIATALRELLFAVASGAAVAHPEQTARFTRAAAVGRLAEAMTACLPRKRGNAPYPLSARRAAHEPVKVSP